MAALYLVTTKKIQNIAWFIQNDWKMSTQREMAVLPKGNSWQFRVYIVYQWKNYVKEQFIQD
jgi:hypothetical protein